MDDTAPVRFLNKGMALNFYIFREGRQLGPFSENEVRLHLLNGKFQWSDLVWQEGASEWKPLSQMELFSKKSDSPPSSPSFQKRESLFLGFSRFLLSLTAAGCILLFYGFSFFCIFLFFILVAFDVVLVLLAARFGLAGVMGGVASRHFDLLKILLGSLWLRKGRERDIFLSRDAAPRFFEMVERTAARLGIQPPQTVVLQMGLAAWIRLPGIRRGGKKSKLGMGFDVFALLTEAEMESVIAHEMAHARFVQQDLRLWLHRGLARARNLAHALYFKKQEARAGRRKSSVIRPLFLAAHSLALVSSRSIAACSRQDEFEADREGARMCGSAVFASTLRKIEAKTPVSARITWKERVARLQSSGNFIQWLHGEFQKDSTNAGKEEQANPYSTHPSLQDRIAALPRAENDAGEDSSGPAVDLLQDSEGLASQLVSELQKNIVEMEQQDTLSLERWIKKTDRGRPTHLSSREFAGTLLIILGVIYPLVGFITSGRGVSISWMGASIVFISTGAAMLFWWKKAERMKLPVPTYLEIKRANKERLPSDELGIRERSIKAKMEKMFEGKKPRDRLREYLRHAYEALGRCDYLEAHVAANFGLRINKKCPEVGIVLAITQAYFGQRLTAKKNLRFIHRQAPKGSSSSWAISWGLFLMGEMIECEGFLLKTLKYHPREPTVRVLLAITQGNRNKLFNAILHAKEAANLSPADAEIRTLLVQLQLAAGLVKDADKELKELEALSPQNEEYFFCMIHKNILQDRPEDARNWVGQMEIRSSSPKIYIRVGNLFHQARQSEAAMEFFQKALRAGHYPEAQFMLGEIQREKNNHEAALQCYHHALNMKLSVGKEGLPVNALFAPILAALNSFGKPTEGCKAWVAKVQSPASSKITLSPLLVYSPDLQGATKYLEEILFYIDPDLKASPQLFWKKAEREYQPRMAVYPGVQGPF